ncbi:hypothetical protein KW785_01205 [Candidatus Parcubacteria bacterium]|nr:hypothetical protein [Candidatus Parcubacteria bacterium]
MPRKTSEILKQAQSGPFDEGLLREIDAALRDKRDIMVALNLDSARERVQEHLVQK